MSALTINDARIRFGHYDALKGISVSVSQGQLVTLLGPSGCGKTTLLRAIAGFIPLDSGTITIDGTDMNGLPPERRNTAMCFQSYALFPHMTVFGNIAFGLQQKGEKKEEIRLRVQASAAQMSLDEHLGKLPAQLSGGQQQRVALARALTVRPGVMLFDEPLSNLDARLREQVRFEIRQLQRKHGFTAIYVTHDQAEALSMSDVVVVMQAGRIEQIGTPHDVYFRPVNRFVANFVGTANTLPVQIIHRDEARNLYRVRSPLGEMSIRSDTPPVAENVYAIWRPEDALLCSPSSAAPNQVRFNIKAQSFLGNLTDLTVSQPGNESLWRVQMTGHASLQEDGTYTFSIAPDKIRFLQETVS